jgi:restriction system protein
MTARTEVPRRRSSATVAASKLEGTHANEQPHGMSFLDAAEYVLRQFGGDQPMHYRDIVRKALDLGLIQTRGRTPEASLNAQVGVEISRCKQRGEPPRFARYPCGLIALATPAQGGLPSAIESQNQQVRQTLHERLLHSSPAEFEDLVGRLLVALGFQDVVVTARSGDGGIDVRGTLVVGDVIRTRMAVQAKRWRHNVQAPVVQQVRGSLGTHDQGLIITTSDFSQGARQEAERPNAVPVGLMNGKQLVAMLVEHQIGVRRVPYVLIELEGRAAEHAGDEQLAAGLARTPVPIEQGDPTTRPRRIRRATARMSSKVDGGVLYVAFAGLPGQRWTLPDRQDKAGIRRARDEAVRFAREHGATAGQENAIKKALTSAGYHLTR